MESFKITVDDRDFVVICFRGRPKALLDRTVAEIYEVPAKRINEAVRRNPDKFPEDFYFELTLDETRTLNEVANCDLDWKGGHLPKAFTHLGCNMLATVLKSKRAVQRAIQIIRTFTALESGGYDRKMKDWFKKWEINVYPLWVIFTLCSVCDLLKSGVDLPAAPSRSAARADKIQIGKFHSG